MKEIKEREKEELSFAKTVTAFFPQRVVTQSFYLKSGERLTLTEVQWLYA